jgi:hypothetical protein
MLLRKPTSNESYIIKIFLSNCFIDNETIINQLKDLKVSDTGDPDNYKSVYLHPADKTQPLGASGRVVVVGNYLESDGMPLDILLHIVDGYLNELEFIKADGTDRLSDIVDVSKITFEKRVY